jgi:DNA-binding GntR family transcriptional regulator
MTALEQLINEPLHERAYAVMREAIKAGKFQPGQAVTVRGLAQDLGISATPAREALQRLIAEQALQLMPNRTVVVPVLRRERFDEITKVRLRLEGLAAAEAVQKISTREIEALATHEKAMNAAIARKQFNAYLLHNEQFHFIIYKAAQMPFTLQVIESAWMQIGPWLNMLISEGRFREAANACHAEIIAFMTARDAEGAARAVQRDISEAAAYLQRHLPSMSAAAAGSTPKPKSRRR